MDGPAAAMLRTLAETPGGAIRTPLRLPPEIDALVVDTREEVLHFAPTLGGRATPLRHWTSNTHVVLISWGQYGASEPDRLIQHVRRPVARPV